MSDASITISYDSTGLDPDTAAITDQTVQDTEQLLNDELQLQEDAAALQKALDDLVNNDESLVTIMVSILPMVNKELEDVEFMLVDTMNIQADLTNLSVAGQNSYMAMVSGADGNISDPNSYTDAEGADDAQNLTDVINLFTETKFTVVYSDGNGGGGTAYSYGLLDLLSDDGTSGDGTSGDEWNMGNGQAMAPLSEQSETMISESLLDIEDSFDSWGNADAMYSEVETWVAPETADDEAAVVDPTIDKINADFDQTTGALQSATQASQAQLQQINNENTEFYSIESDMMDDYNAELQAMTQKMGT